MAEEVLIKPGDVTIDELFITAHDGTDYNLKDEGMFAEINIYEDIWNKFLTGNIALKDATNFITNAPIMGGELITIKLRTNTFEDHPENIIDKSFQIYSIKNRSLNNDREQLYILNFCSVEMMSDQTHTLSKRYKGNTEDIIKDIYDDFIVEARRPMEGTDPTGILIGDVPHISNISFIANNWTPVQTFDFMSKYIRGNKYGGADFIFYESNKRFYFTSLQALIKEGKDNVFEEYVYSPSSLKVKHRSSGDSFIGTPLPLPWCKIDAMKIPRTIDIIDGQDSGYYAQSVRAYDIFTKETLEAEIDVRKDFGKFIHTDEGIPVPQGIKRNPYSMTTLKLLNSVNNMTQTANIPGSKTGNSDSENIIGSSLFRDNYINSFKDYQFEIDVPGRTDIECGNMIYIQYPSPRSKTADLSFDDIYDRQLSGKYIITAIRHKIDTVAHVMKMEIMKNGVPESMGEVETRDE